MNKIEYNHINLQKKAMITKITAEEFDQLKIKGWGRASLVFGAIISLKVNEAIVVPRSMWRRNKPPSSICRLLEKRWAEHKVKYKCVTLADNSGWAIKRLS